MTKVAGTRWMLIVQDQAGVEPISNSRRLSFDGIKMMTTNNMSILCAVGIKP